MTHPCYTLTAGAKRRAEASGKIVVKTNSHAMAKRLKRTFTGAEWYGPLSLGSKTSLYLVDDTPQNRAALGTFR